VFTDKDAEGRRGLKLVKVGDATTVFCDVNTILLCDRLPQPELLCDDSNNGKVYNVSTERLSQIVTVDVGG